jgi:integrase
VQDILDRNVKPVIGTLPLSAVDEDVLANVVRKVANDGARVHASKVLQVLKQMFRYAADNYKNMRPSPAISLRPKGLNARTARRGRRWLRAEELAAFWKALGLSRVDPVTRFGLQFLILTALRADQARTLTWSDIDFKRKLLIIRAEKRKLSPEKAEEAGDWEQPLSEPALGILTTLRALCPKEIPWVFYSPRSKDGIITDHALGRAMKRLWETDEDLKKVLADLLEKAATDTKLQDIKKKPKASPHDLRRSVATHLSGTLKVDRVISQLVLDHSLNRILDSGVANTYDQGDAVDERRVALDRWALWLMEQITPTTTGGKVIAMNQ